MLLIFFYAFIQALTEFLPVSSSGHLAVISNFLAEPDLFVFTILHFASMIAVLLFFRNDIKTIFFSGRKKTLNDFCLILVGILPAGIIGFFLNSLIENAFSNLGLIAFAYFISGIFLLSTHFAKVKNRSLNFKTALIIGFFQIFALLPGISRSGITISSALLLGIERKKAFTFSFFMYIPLACGAFLKELLDIGISNFSNTLILPFLLCLVLSFFALSLLKFILKKDVFWMFSFYSFFMALILVTIKFIY
jgi:undecaprenyl-diphosphatase